MSAMAAPDNIVQQGYLQLLSQGRVQKVFAVLDGKELTCYSEDPMLVSSARANPVVLYDIRSFHIDENAQSKRPKTFGVVGSDGSYIELSCPTNSLKMQWLKQFSQTQSKASSQPPPSAAVMPQANQILYQQQPQQLPQQLTAASGRTITPPPRQSYLSRANLILTPTVSTHQSSNTSSTLVPPRNRTVETTTAVQLATPTHRPQGPQIGIALLTVCVHFCLYFRDKLCEITTLLKLISHLS